MSIRAASQLAVSKAQPNVGYLRRVRSTLALTVPGLVSLLSLVHST